MSEAKDQPIISSNHEDISPYKSNNPIRFVSAASLFDGHDASINIIRRVLQSSGAEVIHLGHNRSVEDLAACAIQEDVQAVALSSYQGGHIEYFKYLRDELNRRGGEQIRIFGGGGGVIVEEEIRELVEYGITHIYTPEDGRRMGLQGIINHMLENSDFESSPEFPGSAPITANDHHRLGQVLSYVENHGLPADRKSTPPTRKVPIVGITGTGGAGKSSLTDELLLRFMANDPELKIALVAIDPTRRKTGGALLGDRIRMNSLSLYPDRIFMRSFATRENNSSISGALVPTLEILKEADFDLILVETTGVGQSESEIIDICDFNMYVMTAEFGAPTQLEKISMLDYANIVVLNKAEKPGSDDALSLVKKQFQRNHNLFHEPVENMPVHATIAGRFNDQGVTNLYLTLRKTLLNQENEGLNLLTDDAAEKFVIIPDNRMRYLSDISDSVRAFHTKANEQKEMVRIMESMDISRQALGEDAGENLLSELGGAADKLRNEIDPALRSWLDEWPETRKKYQADELTFKIRDREIKQKLSEKSLSGLDIPLISLPPFDSKAELTEFYYKENFPGTFPYTAGVFPFRKQDEGTARMFAGEGGPERTNARFHYLGEPGGPARLSTAFDSVTLYGDNPDFRPDIYGKIGNSGVSVPTLADCKRLYSGFDLCAPSTSVSMTINGPAPILLAFYFNTAIDQQIELHLRESGKMDAAQEKIKAFYEAQNLPVPSYKQELPEGHNGMGTALIGLPGKELVDAETYARIKNDTLKKLRGTVQADILKEDQAQNTCIFSRDFSIRLMGDIQEYFTRENIRNFYSVSISGYHIAEAGANPITQLAFTLANGFTYLEHYRHRGMKVDEFAPNFSFFFSNGVDAEYSVIGRVARRIWAVAMRDLYGANDRSQKMKYHIQTSGRSLHAQEVDFNDIRTTLQALYALYDNCNSLHTNSYDEAVTTPTEESVRRALAIQLIINKELGLFKNQNSLQGSYVIHELTQLVEEAVLNEFDQLAHRGGVVGAMETMYQRNKIQEESLHYETLKHTGALPIVGVNTFLNPNPDAGDVKELIRSTEDEKKQQIESLNLYHKAFAHIVPEKLEKLKACILNGENAFDELLDTVQYASLGQISQVLYQVGGSYRRSV